MTPLAWAHLPGSLYPEQHPPPESAFNEWARVWLGTSLHRMQPVAVLRRRLRQRLAQAAHDLASLDDETLRQRLRHQATQLWLDRAGPEPALALVREVARRSLGLLPYDTQLEGAAQLIAGRMVEMQTGEGKTLTAGLAAAVVASVGVPVHVITVNDYLTQRDADEMTPLFSFMGLRTGSIVTGLGPAQRRASYACDITYCTGKELAFDYLKDRAAHGQGSNQARLRLDALLGEQARPTLLRGLYFGIVDEADSVLIDEARTPLILSANAGPLAGQQVLQQAIAVAAEMKADLHFEAHAGRRELLLLPAGRLWLTERCVAMDGEWASRHAREHWIVQALRARHLFRSGEHYVVKDGKVLIVDENTGRALPGRTWEHGLHQIVETMEGCALSDQAATVARITYQRFFRRYLRLAGMTGTAQEVKHELWASYGLHTVVVPTHRPCIRRLLPPLCLAGEAQKWAAIAEQARSMTAAGRPVLVGTRSVQASQRLSAVLRGLGLAHEVLNALQDQFEAELVARAGQGAIITVATNMAGRGTDIKLSDAVRQAGGLHVILSEYHESPRIDRQLFGRAARQGDPGSGQAVVSLQDAVFAQHAAGWLARFRPLVAGRRVAPVLLPRLLRHRAQRAAQRLHARTRLQAVKEDQRLETSLAFSGVY